MALDNLYLHKSPFKSRQIAKSFPLVVLAPSYLTVKQRASLKKQKPKAIISRLWKPKKIKIKYDTLLDGRVSH